MFSSFCRFTASVVLSVEDPSRKWNTTDCWIKANPCKVNRWFGKRKKERKIEIENVISVFQLKISNKQKNASILVRDTKLDEIFYRKLQLCIGNIIQFTWDLCLLFASFFFFSLVATVEIYIIYSSATFHISYIAVIVNIIVENNWIAEVLASGKFTWAGRVNHFRRQCKRMNAFLKKTQSKCTNRKIDGCYNISFFF